MIVNIANEIFTKLGNDIPNAEVVSGYDETVTSFPRIAFYELTNNINPETKDSDGEKHNEQSFQIEIYTIGNKKKSDAMSIRKQVDDIMSGHYNCDRDYSEQLQNFMDRNIYRYVMRYSCIVDANKVIYRR